MSFIPVSQSVVPAVELRINKLIKTKITISMKNKLGTNLERVDGKTKSIDNVTNKKIWFLHGVEPGATHLWCVVTTAFGFAVTKLNIEFNG